MKRTLIFSVLLAVTASAISLTSCKPDPDRPQFAVIEQMDTIEGQSSNFEVDYRLEYLSWYSDDVIARKIQMAQIADFFGGEYVKQSPMESAEAFDRATADNYTRDAKEFGWSGFLKIRSYSDVLNDRVVTFTVERAEYTGGAHGMETTMNSNYDLRTGERLSLDDLFTPEGKATLSEAIRADILKTHGKTTWDELATDHCYNAIEDVTAVENFRLTETHIIFVYNPYDISCYAEGSTTVRLPLNGLDGFKRDMIVK